MFANWKVAIGLGSERWVSRRANHLIAGWYVILFKSIISNHALDEYLLHFLVFIFEFLTVILFYRKQFNFSIEAQYHVCSNSWPNPCENGNIYIYTTDGATSVNGGSESERSENTILTFEMVVVLECRS